MYVVLNARAIATAGFANDVDAVNQQAPMYAATANGVIAWRARPTARPEYGGSASRLCQRASATRRDARNAVGCAAPFMTTAYEQKFVEFLRMCDQANKGNLDVVVVHDPETLGDDYAELVESLNRLADAKLKLANVPRADRGK